MKKLATVAVLAATATSTAYAGGIDRVGQKADIIYKPGTYGEVSFSSTMPSVSGNDLPLATPRGTFNSGASYDSVADDFNSFGFGFKHDISDRFSVAFTGQEDFGSDIAYGGDPRRTNLGGTSANANTYALALIGRFKLNENVSFHAGVRRDTADGTITLGGLAYGRVSGYEVRLSENVGYGYLIGGAYEIPEIAFRVAVTYNSKIRHDFATTETLNGRSIGASEATDVDTPQSVNIDLQTGIAEDTLLFGSIRWAEWSEFKIAPQRFEGLTGSGLVSLDDSTTFQVGLGRRFTEAFSASASIIYEDGGSDDLVSPLAPTNGLTAVTLGGAYRVGNAEISGGVRYNWLGDAKPETGTPDTARADFSNNNAVSVGLKLGYYF
ncbi:hypothetical protein G5B39_11805 [Rhodobacteraceae bacterium SC52]|nr:hypothetical protein G5B39_11805 [Rhodobacteraceae bacterium SC52]